MMKHCMPATLCGLVFATVAATAIAADPAAAAAPATPAVAQIKLAADPQKGLEAKQNKEVKLTTAEPSRYRLVPGLKDKSFVSLEAVGHTGFFLRHQKFVMYLHQRPKTTNVTFEADSSFKLIHLDGDKVRFEPSTWPGYFITARPDGSVIIARDPAPEESTFVLKEAKD